MFKSPKDYILVALVLAIILLIIFWPSKPLETNGYVKQYESKIQSLERQKAQKDAQVATLFKESQSKDSTTKVALRAKDKEISLLKIKLSKQRPPIVLMADSVPELKAYIQTQDSLLLATEQMVDTIRKAYDFQVKVSRDLQTLVVDKDKIADEMLATCNQQLEKMDKLANKEHKRKGVWKKIAGIAVTIALVEGALIALQ